MVSISLQAKEFLQTSLLYITQYPDNYTTYSQMQVGRSHMLRPAAAQEMANYDGPIMLQLMAQTDYKYHQIWIAS